MVIKEKYTALIRAAIILAVVNLILIGILAGIIVALTRPIQYEPSNGTWYCNKLGLQVVFGSDRQAYLQIDGEDRLCTFESIPKTQQLKVYTVAQVEETECGKIYIPGDLLFEFSYLDYNDDTFTAEDSSGKIYCFVRTN